MPSFAKTNLLWHNEGEKGHRNHLCHLSTWHIEKIKASWWRQRLIGLVGNSAGKKCNRLLSKSFWSKYMSRAAEFLKKGVNFTNRPSLKEEKAPHHNEGLTFVAAQLIITVHWQAHTAAILKHPCSLPMAKHNQLIYRRAIQIGKKNEAHKATKISLKVEIGTEHMPLENSHSLR